MRRQTGAPPPFRPAGESDEFDTDDEEFEMSGTSAHRKRMNQINPIVPTNGHSNPDKNYAADDEDWGREDNTFSPKHLVNKVPISPSEEARIACAKGDVEKIQKLLDSEAIKVNCEFPDEYSPLITAAAHGQSQLVKFLLERGADVKQFSRGTKTTALLAAVACTFSRTEDDILECVKLLVEAGAMVNALDRNAVSPLVTAIRRRNERRKVAQYLLDHEANPNVQDICGRTCLFYAAEVGDGQSCRLLLEKRADVNLIDDSGWSAYDVGCEKGFEELGELLYRVRCTKWKPGDNPVLMLDIDEAASKQTEAPAEGVSIREDSQIEMMLSSIEASKYFKDFRKHRITYIQFLHFDEDDLKAVGVEEVGIRKKLLESIRAVQNQEWSKDSLKWVAKNKKVTAGETLCIVNNMKHHIKYMFSTMNYFISRIGKDPKSLKFGIENNKLEDIINLLEEVNNENFEFEKKVLELIDLIHELKNNAEFQPGDQVKVQDKKLKNLLDRWNTLKENRKIKQRSKSSVFLITSLVAVSGCVYFGWRKFLC